MTAPRDSSPDDDPLPVIYYGDEIGMGDNLDLDDRHGLRTPMQWSSGRNAGFSPADPRALQLPVVTDPGYHFEAVNVEAQESDPGSLLAWTRRLIGVRRRCRPFGRGSAEFLAAENPRVLAFVRRYGEERILVVANLSAAEQRVELDLRAAVGLTGAAVDLFGEIAFPPVGRRPWALTLAPHAWHWIPLSAAAGAAGGDCRESR